ncbi:hypothetical protein D3C72_197420 [compost metagenome]
MSELPFPESPGTVLLSAGPGAGKSRLLSAWARVLPDACFLTLGDRPLRDLLSELWPEASTRAAELGARFPSLTWGAALGMALAEQSPTACLLVDDVHAADACLEELLPFLRHFPEEGLLVLASRHRLPDLGREATLVVEAEHPVWQTRIAPEHLLALPEPLLARALVLHLLGPMPLDPESQELERRNVVTPGPGYTHRLHPAWSEAADSLLAHPLTERTWDRIEQLVMTHADRVLRTEGELALGSAIARLPASILTVRPALASLCAEPSSSLVAPSGSRMQHYRAFRELSASHERAMAQGEGEQAFANAMRMIALAVRHGFHRDLLEAHVARLEAQLLREPAPPLAQLIDIPDEAFGNLSAAPRFIRCLARRAAALGEEALAKRLGAEDELPRSQVQGFRLRAFGPLEILDPDGTQVKLPRKKALFLLALLILHPEGMSARELARQLFDEEIASPSEALHTITYALRKALRTVGGEHLFESSGGFHRLRWHAFAVCDLHEFEALVGKAMSLERQGLRDAARLFRRLATAYVRGRLLEDFPEAFDESRARIERHSRQGE